MTIENHIGLGKTIGWLTFVLGTLLFLNYYLNSNSSILFLGYGYIIFAVLINIGVFISILIRKSEIKIKGIFYLLKLASFNLFTLITYCYLAITLMNTMRITFLNKNSSAIENIKVTGCEIKEIENIEGHNSQSVWINIKSDCEISIEYTFEGKVKKETVRSYATPFSGEKISHTIGIGEKII